eukprot:TRINITY_DN3365_c0_g1_i9.p1 TRINITY_DN3365_c0_g1~~TRINITY_DN3365_c0_g1_i9.p1  ORF type:complete len:146 (-),score=53.71 TRINITY_DN3365_c0_g1_i9:106-543(-)
MCIRDRHIKMDKIDNSLVIEAQEYLREHRILELFEDLCSHLAVAQPENVEQFLIEQLKLKKEQGPKYTIYSENELDNIFKLFDLRERGYITKDQCKKALSTIAHSEYHYKMIQDDDIPEKVDIKDFKNLCGKILGVSVGEMQEAS